MDAGLHGVVGYTPTLNGYIWSMFVIPQFLYGPEVQLLKNKGHRKSKKIQRKCLKQIQGLPDSTSITACLALLGILPVEAILHKNLLNMFVNMIRNENSIDYKRAQRQLIMRESFHTYSMHSSSVWAAFRI